MISRDDDDSCTYSECGHVKCSGCTIVMMSVSLTREQLDSFGSPFDRANSNICSHGNRSPETDTADGILASDER
jgi:hypothetical protein